MKFGTDIPMTLMAAKTAPVSTVTKPRVIDFLVSEELITSAVAKKTKHCV